jgi:hypothetical protein
MTIDERSRHELYLKLEQVLGPEPAAVLMEHLPPVGWGDVATRRDLDHLAAATKQDLDHLAADTKQDLDHLRDELISRIETSEQRLRAEFGKDLAAQTRTFVLAMTGAVVTVGGLAVTAARLG